jgi:cob(I)alamin adenosyltransferase
MSYYSRRGDDGTTGWLGKGRLKKSDLRIETLGALDEASAALGQARSSARDPRAASLLQEGQRDLYQLMAEVSAAPGQASRFHFETGRVQWLEAQIDALAAEFPMPREFILPGDSPGGAAMALARAIVRRAERRVVELLSEGGVTNSALQQYLNRLSSLLFVLELAENKAAGRSTTFARQNPEDSKP